jgi:pentatricopeptide repeat protein
MLKKGVTLTEVGLYMSCNQIYERKRTFSQINHAITAAGRLGRIDDALELFNSIPNMDYVPDLMSYNNIIWCAGHLGKVDLAKRLFHTLSSKTQHRPNVYTYGALMHAFAKSKDYKQALIYLDTMTKNGIKPNQVWIILAFVYINILPLLEFTFS